MKTLIVLRFLFSVVALLALSLAISEQSWSFVFGFLTLSWAAYAIHRSLLRTKKEI